MASPPEQCLSCLSVINDGPACVCVETQGMTQLIGGVALLAVFAGPVLKEGFGAGIGTWVVVGEPGPRLSRLACYQCWRHSLW